MTNKGHAFSVRDSRFSFGLYYVVFRYSTGTKRFRVVWGTQKFMLNDVSSGLVGDSSSPRRNRLSVPSSFPPVRVQSGEVERHFSRTAITLAYTVSSHQQSLIGILSCIVKLSLVGVGIVEFYSVEAFSLSELSRYLNRFF